MTTTNLSLIYVTCPDTDCAKQLCQSLLNNNLIACGNIIPGMISMYRWKKQIKNDNECVLILKTQSSLFKSVEQYLLKEHPYDTPCIIEIQPDNITQDFESWLINSTSKDL